MVAGIFFPSCVTSHMRRQVPTVGKILFTLRAGKGFSPGVNYIMHFQVSRLEEGLVTGGAGKWLISCVYLLVSLHFASLSES